MCLACRRAGVSTELAIVIAWLRHFKGTATEPRLLAVWLTQDEHLRWWSLMHPRMGERPA